ncbi:putative glycosyltransferase [Belliella baltica DSM 15883]|uniref:Putative glycosyltransferase n=1 Tax=Belliella baltica (strain DSM 15883 / CIP 108006 / LMG 21964 / BA134) TaxID=866536 RepID=I3Z0F5_BELBD|nr:glycosyltransferase family 2 protein [Belliella baltica]AFL82723.1 putative glycosyltransferase [Belliella baltica DSM 15883]
MQKAAIVILNYNGEEMLKRFLPSVLEHSYYPVIIADNASTDNSLLFLAQNYPLLQVLKLEKNTGFAGGYNEVLLLLQGHYEYYILLNSDVEVTPFWDRKLIDFLEQNPKYVAVQPKILSVLNEGYFDYAGAGGGFLDHLGYPYCRGRIFDSIEKDSSQYNDTVEVDWTSGACMAIKAEVFNKFEGFDDRFFAHMEEIDLCWRIRSAGFKVAYFGEVEVKHLGGGTLSRSSPRKTFLNFRNNLIMLHKNLPLEEFRKKYFVRILLDCLAAIVFLFQGKNRESKAIFEAHYDFQRIKKISKVNSMALNLSSKSVKKIDSIVWQYYVKNKKLFSEL